MNVWTNDQVHPGALEDPAREEVRYLISSPGVILLEASTERTYATISY